MRSTIARWLTLTLVLLFHAAPAAFAVPWMIQEAATSSFSLSVGGSGASELSGLTWTGGSTFYAVSDNSADMYPLTIGIDLADGTIDSAAVGTSVSLAGSDLEGIAFVSPDHILVSDESGPNVRLHNLTDGSLVETLTLPAVLGNVRSNLSLEAVAWDTTNGYAWTTSEEALSVDGPVSSFSLGTVVRLFRFDDSFAATGQWAYVTDAIPGDRPPSGRDIELSGVPSLAVLPDGTLLVLERALGNSAGLRHRIYQIDFTAASDVSALAALDGASYTPVSKTLLWERTVLLTNFEGMALGPTLNDGSQSLVLVSDNGSGLASALFALKVRPLVCGDGVKGGSETCDDGNVTSGDGCDATCIAETCGDGLVNNGGAETCEDGNLIAGDGCDPTCNLERDAVGCQRAIAKAAGAYANARIAAEQACRNGLNQGKELVRASDGSTPVVDAADCGLEERAAGKIAHAGSKVRSSVAKKCTDTMAAALDTCAATVDGLVDASGSAGCLIDGADDEAGVWLAAAYGATIPVEQAERRRCQEVIGKAGLKYFGTALKSVQACRNGLQNGKDLYYDADKSLPLWDPSDCPAEYRTSTKIVRAGDKLRAAVADRCSDFLVAALVSLCASTVDGLVDAEGVGGCLVDSATASVATLVAAQYGQ